MNERRSHHKATHGKVVPDPRFLLPSSISGYSPSRRTEIRPAFERAEGSGPVLVLVRDGKPVFESVVR